MIASMRVAGAQLDSPVGTCVWHRGSERGLTKCQTFWPHFLPVPAVAPYHLSFFCWLSKDNNFYTCFDEFFVCLCFDEWFVCLCFDEFFACSCLFGMGILFSRKVFFVHCLSMAHVSCFLWCCCGVVVVLLGFFWGGGGICRGVYFVPITNFVVLLLIVCLSNNPFIFVFVTWKRVLPWKLAVLCYPIEISVLFIFSLVCFDHTDRK